MAFFLPLLPLKQMYPALLFLQLAISTESFFISPPPLSQPTKVLKMQMRFSLSNTRY